MSKIIVKSKSERGFRRAGMQFTREGVELHTSKLEEGVLEELQAEPNLVITEMSEEEAGGNKKPEGDLGYRVLKSFEFQGAKIEPAVNGQEPVFIQLSTEEAEKLIPGGFISTAEVDVSLPSDAKKARQPKARAK
ncbi:MAG TPA: HI1506-related protein [Pseudoxanthomonas sp.]|nr:HI1506-related protein [Pseudoxanthomonas sp.]